MSIRRGERPADNFTIVANGLLRDPRLSFKARGLAAYLLSHADGFRSTTGSIARANHCGLDQVRSALQELERFGYLHRERNRNDSGHNTDTDYVITDQPEDPGSQGWETQRRTTQHGETPPHKKNKGLEDQSVEESKPANAGLAAPSSSGGYADDDAPPLLAGLEPPANSHRTNGAGPSKRKSRGRAEAPSTTVSTSNAAAAGGDEPGVTAQTVTATWVDAYRDAHQGVEPTRSLIGRVSRCAKELLTAGNDPDRVVRAAQSAGRQGWSTIDRELARLASGPSTNGVRGGHVPYRDLDASSYSTVIQ